MVQDSVSLTFLIHMCFLTWILSYSRNCVVYYCIYPTFVQFMHLHRMHSLHSTLEDWVSPERIYMYSYGRPVVCSYDMLRVNPHVMLSCDDQFLMQREMMTFMISCKNIGVNNDHMYLGRAVSDRTCCRYLCK